MKQRLLYLDGHRGIAILMVVLFHAFAKWPGIVPYGDRYQFPFTMGWIGVELFFLISGFVILMTLEACRSFPEFIYRRWLRLFPAMLFCSVVIFLSSPVFPERPSGTPTFLSILPGLLFIEPNWIGRLLAGHPIQPLEGSFWSLYVEFKFYVVAGLLYFALGRTRLIIVLSVICSVSFLCEWLGSQYPRPAFEQAAKVVSYLSFQHFGWFAAGAATYIYTKTKKMEWFVFACITEIVCSLLIRLSKLESPWDLDSTVAGLVVSAFFMLSIVNYRTQQFLSLRPLQFFGFISYPLYLSHENLMVSTIAKLGAVWPGAPMYLLPVIPVFCLSLFAYVCAKFVEPRIKDFLKLEMFSPRKKQPIAVPEASSNSLKPGQAISSSIPNGVENKSG